MKCEQCAFYVVLNPHEIKGSQPVKHCSKGEHPDYCKVIWDRSDQEKGWYSR